MTSNNGNNGHASNLSTADLEKLAQSFITPELAAQAGLRRVDSTEGARIVGRKVTATRDYAGLAIPYYWPGNPNRREERLRRDNPDLEQQPDGTIKEKNKYLSPPGRRNMLYIAPSTDPAWLDNPMIPADITEGEKKTLALSRLHTERDEEVLAVGVCGVWNWRGTVGKTENENGKRVDVKGVIPDFDRIVWKGREVRIIYDPNARTNNDVNRARRSLTKELRRRGAIVRIVELPDEVPGVNGIDDLLGIKGPGFVANLIKQARESGKPPAKTKIGSIVFSVSEEEGVKAIDEENNVIWVCSYLEIEADTRDEHSENWGRLLKFSDRDGILHTWAMPMSLLSRDGAEYREYLLNQGLIISPGRKARTLLETYLNTKPANKALCVTRQGWHRQSFVLPNETIGGENAEPIYLQTPSINHLFKQSGQVEEWRDLIAQYCVGNLRLILAVSIAFAAPLLEPLQGESGGWHLTGRSSTGKTTALYVAGSVHGGGGDKGFIRRWRATINGLETVGEAHHDALLCLDEIAECRPDDVNEASYMLPNGQGKTRQSRGGALRRTLEWRLVFLSSGEISIADHVAQAGKRVRAGQEVRVINLPADADKGLGLFENIHGFESPDAFARHLQRASRDYYGTPIREFLHRIVGDLDGLRQKYRTFETELLSEMLSPGAASEVSRVAHRFALAAFAGEQATDYGITGWQPDEATAAAKALFQVWLEARGTIGSVDEEAAIRQVRAFIEQHGHSRFQRLDMGDERTVINRAGYIRPESDGNITEFYILPETFRIEVCKGFDVKIVINALKQRGLLAIKEGRNQIQLRTPEGRVWTYGIKSDILAN